MSSSESVSSSLPPQLFSSPEKTSHEVNLALWESKLDCYRLDSLGWSKMIMDGLGWSQIVMGCLSLTSPVSCCLFLYNLSLSVLLCLVWFNFETYSSAMLLCARKPKADRSARRRPPKSSRSTSIARFGFTTKSCNCRWEPKIWFAT